MYPKASRGFFPVPDSGWFFWPQQLGLGTTEKVKKVVDKAVETAGAIAFKNALSHFLSKIAQDTAVWIASGGKGAKPLFITEGWGSYLGKAGDEALGIFMYDLFNTNRKGHCQYSKDRPCQSDSQCPLYVDPTQGPIQATQLEIMIDQAVNEGDENKVDQLMNKYENALRGYINEKCVISTPVNVCEPADLQTKLIIQYSLIQAKDPNLRTPQCTWSELSKNWRQSIQDKDFIKNISVVFDPVQTDIGIWLSVRTDLDNAMGNAVDEATKAREGGKGFVDLTSLIGKIKAPATIISKTAEQTIEDRSKKESTYTGKIWADALGVFTTTLANRLMDKWIKKGMAEINNLINPRKGSFGGLQFGDLKSGYTPEQAAREIYAGLGKPDYAGGGSVGITTMLSSQCETDPQQGSEQFCGIIDSNFSAAIDQKLTVKQAVDQGLVKGDRPFGFIYKDVEPNYRDGIPYRSILVLRKYRIVPVGWELAAQYINKFKTMQLPDEAIPTEIKGNLSLKYLLDNYNNPNSPFYKLVDPAWQLKAPETICYREGPGPDIIQEYVQCPTLEAGKQCTAETEDALVYLVRRTYCADERSCIIENDDGTGCKFYGYCAEEKPIWRIQGEQCPAYLNTCESFTTKNGIVNYLENTLTKCSTPDCTAYCEDFNPVDDSWSCENGIKYYKSTNTCAATDEGCASLIRVGLTPLSPEEIPGIDINNTNYIETPVNLKLASQYKGTVYDCSEPNNNNKYCENFAISCDANDISCRLYTPVTINAPAVPAVISSDDQCPESCVGYRTYTQQATQFETQTQESFITNTAKQCNEPGCDQFTNLDEVARGGDGIEYYSYLRLCVKSNDDKAMTFYTWEGSDTQGYQLKKWFLQADGDKKSPLGKSCVVADKSLDCREFYNPDAGVSGEYFAINFATVVFASDDCHPFRRTLDNIIYYGIPSYSTLCSANNAGCRTYRDNTSYNYQVILQDDFEDNNIDGWSTGEISNDSVKKDGHSLKFDNIIDYDLSSADLVAGDNYAVTYLARSHNDLEEGKVIIRDGNNILIQKSFDVKNDWGLNSIDLGVLPDGSYTNPQLRIIVHSTTQGFYINLDWIILKRINNLLVIKDSWEIKPECEDLAGQGMQWCDAFTDNLGQKWNLQKFSKLCNEDVVGCEAMIGFNKTTEAREWQYYVYDKTKICSQPGCTRLGEVVRDKFEPNEEDKFTFNNNFIILNNLTSSCVASEDRCLSFNYDNSSGYNYYKDPKDRVCEFKDGNWWVVGEENIKCPRSDIGDGWTKHCLGGQAFNLKPGDDNICQKDSECLDYYTFNGESPAKGICTSWVGICPNSESGCQEYQDPFEPQYCDNNLLPYQTSSNSYNSNTPACNFYWYKNVDTESCSGPDESNGCVKFVDTSKETQVNVN